MQLIVPRPIDDRPLSLVDAPPPRPGPRDVLIRVAACGVCHTDLHLVEGELPMEGSPRIPGHQVVGRIVERGAKAHRFEIGERIGVAWLHQTCGTCDYCRDGRENLCDAARFSGWHVDGGYAEFARVPEAFAYAIPDVFSDIQAAPLLCAGIIGYRALRRAEVRPGQRLGLYGFGASAHLAIQIARRWNCEVFVFSRSETHRELARRLGAAWTGPADDTPPAPLDSAVIFAPAGKLVPPALRSLARGGTLALAGIHMSAIPALDYAEHLYGERTLRSVANATRRDGEEFLALAAQVPIHVAAQTFPLDQANTALQLLKCGGIDGAAVLQIPSD